MSVIVPVRAFAIAAFEAAKIHGEEPVDIFDHEHKSRARFVAISAMRIMFNDADEKSIAHSLGFSGCLTALGMRMQCVRCANWWREDDVETVVKELEIQLDRRRGAGQVKWLTREVEPRVEVPEKRADSYQRRVFSPARVISAPRRPSNVTSFLMGDPGSTSARVARNERSAGG